MADEEKRSIAWIDGFAILVAVMLSSSVQAANDYEKEKQFRHLNQIADDKKMISVYRDGQITLIHCSKVLTGDVVMLTEGMEIPADGFVLEANEVLCDESAMTGETEPLVKSALSECIVKRNECIAANPDRTKVGIHEIPSPLLFSGSRVLQGEGKFLVFVVGSRSCLGKIRDKLEEETESTPLQEKLEHLARGIGKFGLISAILIFLVLLIRFAAERIEKDNFYKEKHWKELIDYVLIAV